MTPAQSTHDWTSLILLFMLPSLEYLTGINMKYHPLFQLLVVSQVPLLLWGSPLLLKPARYGIYVVSFSSILLLLFILAISKITLLKYCNYHIMPTIVNLYDQTSSTTMLFFTFWSFPIVLWFYSFLHLVESKRKPLLESRSVLCVYTATTSVKALP